MTVCVIGLGKVGLPLAVQIASKGIETLGVDVDASLVEKVNRGTAPFAEPELTGRLAKVIESGHFRASKSTEPAVSGSEVVVVIVPLMLDSRDKPDFASLDAATKAVGTSLRRGTLVIVETTVPVGTTRNRLVPMLEVGSGLNAGTDFLVAFSPERISSGSVFRDLRRYPKLVGGIDENSSKAAARFYEDVLDFDDRSDLTRPNGVWDLNTSEAAELVKLIETTYRDVNIALANEFAVRSESLGLDVWEIIDAANSQPFSHIHRPGIAVGGHCIPVYPHLYLAGHPDAVLPKAARNVNLGQPSRIVARLVNLAGSIEGKTVAVLGASYRGGVKEAAYSGVFPTVQAIADHGGRPVVHDPLYTDEELSALGFTPYHLGEPCHAAVIQADHPDYAFLVPPDLPHCQVLVDGRGILNLDPWRGEATKIAVIGRP